MRIDLKNIAILSVAAAGMLSSCQDNRNQYMLPDQAYITRSGEIIQTAYNTNDAESTLQLWATKGGNSHEEGYVWFDVDESLLREYNAGLPLDAQLSLLPEECYELSEQPDYYLTDETPQAPFEVTYNVSKIAALSYGQRFMLPVRLHSSGIATNPEKNTALVIFNVLEPTIYVAGANTPRAFAPSDDDYTGSYTADVTFAVDFETEEDFDLTLEVGDQADVDAYNATLARGGFTLLPAEFYTLTNTTPTLFAGEREAPITFTIVDAVNLPKSDMVLPIRLVSASSTTGSALVVDESVDTYYIIVRNSLVWLTTAEQKAGWTPVRAYSIGGDGVSKDLRVGIDGDLATYIGVRYGRAAIFDNGQITEAKPQWWVYDLGENPDPKYDGNWNLNAMQIAMRNASVNGTARIYFTATEPIRGVDGIDGTDTGYTSEVFNGTYKPLDDPAWGEPITGDTPIMNMTGNTFRNISFSEPKEGRYIMLYFIGGGENLAWAEFNLQIIQ